MTNVNGKSDIIPTESETTRTVGNFSHGSRETPATSSSPMELDRSEKARCQHPDMHVAGESDSSIVPEKLANNGGVPSPAELVEGRGLTKENTEGQLFYTEHIVSQQEGKAKRGRSDHIGYAARGVFPTNHVINHPETPKPETSGW